KGGLEGEEVGEQERDHEGHGVERELQASRQPPLDHLLRHLGHRKPFVLFEARPVGCENRVLRREAEYPVPRRRGKRRIVSERKKLAEIRRDFKSPPGSPASRSNLVPTRRAPAARRRAACRR